MAAIQSSGARIELCEPGLRAREQRLKEILAAEPGEVVHPFDDARIIAGQGTAVLELLAEVPGLEVISTPVGGGGLITGSALAAKAMVPGIRVIGAEPEQADDAYQSLRAGERREVRQPDTIADGLRGFIGVRNFALLQSHVDDVVTVSEAEIVAAMKIVLCDLKLLIEPSSGVAVAAALKGALGEPGQRVGTPGIADRKPPFASGDQWQREERLRRARLPVERGEFALQEPGSPAPIATGLEQHGPHHGGRGPAAAETGGQGRRGRPSLGQTTLPDPDLRLNRREPVHEHRESRRSLSGSP